MWTITLRWSEQDLPTSQQNSPNLGVSHDLEMIRTGPTFIPAGNSPNLGVNNHLEVIRTGAKHVLPTFAGTILAQLCRYDYTITFCKPYTLRVRDCWNFFWWLFFNFLTFFYFNYWHFIFQQTFFMKVHVNLSVVKLWLLRHWTMPLSCLGIEHGNDNRYGIEAQLTSHVHPE